MIEYLNVKSGLRVKGEWTFKIDGEVVAKTKNTIVSSGLAFIAKLLSGEEPSSMSVHVAAGSDDSETIMGNTTLVSEGFRKVVTKTIRTGALVRFRTVMAQDECNGDWEEFGIVLAGTNIANSGTLLNRALSKVTKTSTQVLTIEVKVTIE